MHSCQSLDYSDLPDSLLQSELLWRPTYAAVEAEAVVVAVVEGRESADVAALGVTSSAVVAGEGELADSDTVD